MSGNHSHRFLLLEKNGDREQLLYDADELEDVRDYVNLKVGEPSDLEVVEEADDWVPEEWWWARR